MFTRIQVPLCCWKGTSESFGDPMAVNAYRDRYVTDMG